MLVGALANAHDAAALDKQGSAHGGAASLSDADDGGFHVSGAASLGVSLYNPTYAARPDNTGLALLRYALHADFDLLGRALSIPLDVNAFTDRTRRGALVLSPTELDVITGATTTRPLGPGALELGARVEHDRPVDEGSFSQTYVDARARYLYSLAGAVPGLGDALWDGDVSGFLTLGAFAVNPTYAARPDNSGLALLRYGAHAELSGFHDHVSLGGDATMFTDRAASAFRPSELDATAEVIGRVSPFELHLAYERDMTIDGRGDAPSYTQSFVYALVAWAFDSRAGAPEALETRGVIVSP